MQRLSLAGSCTSASAASQRSVIQVRMQRVDSSAVRVVEARRGAVGAYSTRREQGQS